ncbi:hypothetical protein SNEBB_005373 [Seison nebaliae]|nr:hypothetical protein SNEBB_005373 [Seison nebaliae]
MYYFYFSCTCLITITFIINHCGCLKKITFIPDALQYDFETEMRESPKHETYRRRTIDTKKPEMELMSKIKNFPKLRTTDMTNKYLSPHVIHAVYEAQNIEKHPFCNSADSLRVRRNYHNYQKIRVLGEGAQGTVYKIINQEGIPPEAVMKTYNAHGDFIMQVNAQYALNRLIPSFQLLGVLRSVDETKTIMRNAGC